MYERELSQTCESVRGIIGVLFGRWVLNGNQFSQSACIDSMAPPTQVTVHPLVLLSVVDHYHRVANNTNKRVVGVLLGSCTKGEVDITNSFAGT